MTMRVELQGLKARSDDYSMDGVLIHKGRRMTNDEIRWACEYGLKHGYKTMDEIPEEVIDKICDPYCSQIQEPKYDDAPEYYSLECIAKTLRRMQNCYNVDWDADDIMDKIRDEI